ncbi:MAG: ABC transporter ATP-binding protein, partial [Alphaproteobacteria bacterium]|nr:ABC transporter ATP-binding protein [Alphaproteobacteria bacterium]
MEPEGGAELAGPVISARELSLVFQTADAPVYALSKVNL